MRPKISNQWKRVAYWRRMALREGCSPRVARKWRAEHHAFLVRNGMLYHRKPVRKGPSKARRYPNLTWALDVQRRYPGLSPHDALMAHVMDSL